MLASSKFRSRSFGSFGTSFLRFEMRDAPLPCIDCDVATGPPGWRSCQTCDLTLNAATTSLLARKSSFLLTEAWGMRSVCNTSQCWLVHCKTSAPRTTSS
jgi:hypothetical protein